MAFDLRGALLKKQEKESARLADFEFRLRARTLRLLAPRLSPALDADALVREIALGPDEAILETLARRFPGADVAPLFDRCRVEARRQLIEELGDPAPHRLA